MLNSQFITAYLAFLLFLLSQKKLFLSHTLFFYHISIFEVNMQKIYVIRSTVEMKLQDGIFNNKQVAVFRNTICAGRWAFKRPTNMKL